MDWLLCRLSGEVLCIILIISSNYHAFISLAEGYVGEKGGVPVFLLVFASCRELNPLPYLAKIRIIKVSDCKFLKCGCSFFPPAPLARSSVAMTHDARRAKSGLIRPVQRVCLS